ncbi:unnamed protein product, partial [marine sediment metagenome]
MIYGLLDQIQFGKYEAWTLEEVIEEQIEYISWCINNVDDFKLDGEARLCYGSELNRIQDNADKIKSDRERIEKL